MWDRACQIGVNVCRESSRALSAEDEFHGVDEDLQIAGNVIGDAPSSHLANYNRYANGGGPNVSAPHDAMTSKLTARACAEWAAGKGADCSRLAPLFELLKRLPEP